MKIFLVIVLLLVATVFIVPIFLPENIQFEQKRNLQASPELVFEYVNCLKKWEFWSPWSDSSICYSYEGPDCGVGSTMKWEHEKTGKGKQFITESQETTFIRIELDLGLEEPAISSWKFDTLSDGGTRVSWGYSAGLSYPFRRWLNFLFVERMLKLNYENGLENLDKITAGVQPLGMKYPETLSILCVNSIFTKDVH
jgi:ribosome-associated toxin RatA of RatAB toxin-antitoxin module